VGFFSSGFSSVEEFEELIEEVPLSEDEPLVNPSHPVAKAIVAANKSANHLFLFID
jgi:hypothetical protein